jgi:hypothetical protein
MSCDITHGRLEQCKDIVGGLQAIYVLNFGEFDPTTDVTYTAGTDEISAIALTTAGTPIYKFELKGTNSFETTITSSRENGTTFFEQVLAITLKKQDVQTHKEVKLLTYGRPNIIVRTNANQYFIAGLERGMDVTAGTIGNGTNLGDMSGYSLTFTGQEAVPANFLDCTTEAGLATLLNNAVITV